MTEENKALIPEELSDEEFDKYFTSISVPDYDDVPDDDDERYIPNSSKMRAFYQEQQTAKPEPEPAAPEKKSLKDAIGNFVYYHKPLCIGALAAVVFAFIWFIVRL